MHKSKRCVWRYRPVPWQNAKAEFNTCQDKTMFFLLLVFALTFLTEKCSVSHGHEKTLINSARQTNTPTIRCASAHATLTLLSIMQTGDISWMDLIRNSPYCMQMTTTITTDENNWVLMIDERKRSKLWMVILGYATCTLLTNVFLTEPLRYLAFLTNRGNVQSVFFAKDLQVTQRLECTLFAHILHTDIKPSFLLTSLTSFPHKTHPYTCVSGVLFPGDHCIFSFVFCLFWPFSVYSQSHKAVRISDSIWQPSPFIRQNSEEEKQTKKRSELEIARTFWSDCILIACFFLQLASVLDLVKITLLKLLQFLNDKISSFSWWN